MASQTRHLAICPDGMKHPDRNNLASMRSSPMRLVIEVKEGEEEDPTPKSTTKVFEIAGIVQIIDSSISQPGITGPKKMQKSWRI